jgi:hypothetical protein
MSSVSLPRRHHEDRDVAKITKNPKLSFVVGVVVFGFFVTSCVTGAVVLTASAVAR